MKLIEELKAVVAAANAAKTDLICLMGDYLDGFRWEKWYRENGFHFLVNDCTHPRPGLALAGVNDPVVQRYGGYDNVLPNVETALCVNPGVGLWAGFPLRFFDPAELTVFTLRRKDG